MKDTLWKLIAKIVSWSPVANWLIARSQETPYTHLTGYMERWWLFNPYAPLRPRTWLSPLLDRLPSIRVHHILRADRGRDVHDHPWNARTILLRHGYTEVRMVDGQQVFFSRLPGDTATLRFGEFHRIVAVPPDGVWTLFITWKYQGTWGFLVGGKKVPHREYKGELP